uniref:Uncharacterized protein n=1 Tax=Timema cristinae TaxID=61476 RepID=A0A7R9D9Z0_TIMCR|nr:unnamed protein product [Timema cristinae]
MLHRLLCGHPMARFTFCLGLLSGGLRDSPSPPRPISLPDVPENKIRQISLWHPLKMVSQRRSFKQPLDGESYELLTVIDSAAVRNDSSTNHRGGSCSPTPNSEAEPNTNYSSPHPPKLSASNIRTEGSSQQPRLEKTSTVAYIKEIVGLLKELNIFKLITHFKPYFARLRHCTDVAEKMRILIEGVTVLLYDPG